MSPELDTVLQLWPYQWWIMWGTTSTDLMNGLFDAAYWNVCLCHKVTLLAYVLLVTTTTRAFFCQAAFQLFSPQHVDLFLPKSRTLLRNLHKFSVSLFLQGPFLWQHSCPQPPHTFTVALAGSFSSCDTNPPFVKYCEEVLLPKILSNKWNKKISRDPVHQRKLLFHVSKSHFLWIPIINQEKQQCFTVRQFSRNLWMLGSGKLE